MTPWRTYADPPSTDPGMSREERRRAGRQRRDEVGFAEALSTSGSGYVVWMCSEGLDAVTDRPGGSAKPPLSGSAGAVLDAADVDDALPGPWEADLIALARTEASGAKAVLALAEAYQRAVGAVADEPLHAARAEAGRRARRLAAGVPRDAARSADTAVRRLVSSGTRLRRNRVAEGWSVRPGGSAEPPLSGSVADAPDPTVEMAQYRESLSEPGAQLLVQYALADAVVSDDGRMLALLARGADDVLLLEGRPVAPSTREPQWGAWRDGSDVHRVLLARETIPLVPVELGGWSTSADGSVARVWSRARIATESLALGGRRERARSLGTALGLIHAVNGDAAALAGYLGRSRAFPEALREAVA